MAHSSPYPFLLFTTLFVFILSTSAQNTANYITVGSSLTATENSIPWRSPSGDFAFGFQQLQDDRDFFVLSIWFDKIPDKTIVWYEARSYPVPRGSTVELNATHGLVLQDTQGVLLYNSYVLGDEVAYGFMNNTGNFVLLSRNSSFLWESFRNPADTILPTQTLEINHGQISRTTQTNFSQGRFYARMNTDGNFVLSAGSDNYYRATLDFDGVFTQYYHPKNFGSNPQWAPIKSLPDDICASSGGGVCGYNSLCRLKNQRPICECLEDFSWVDPNNTYGNCKPNYSVQNCDQVKKGSQYDEYELLEITDIDWWGK